MNQGAVLNVYDILLSQRIREGSIEELHLSNVRLRLLNSLLIVAKSLVGQTQEKQPGFFYNQMSVNIKREVSCSSTIEEFLRGPILLQPKLRPFDAHKLAYRDANHRLVEGFLETSSRLFSTSTSMQHMR